jgi:23S rRNA (uridine2552-2'-O)-methyltransferase
MSGSRGGGGRGGPGRRKPGGGGSGGASSGAGGSGGSSGSSGRGLTQKLKPGKRSLSSRRWLSRQLGDPFVAEARRQGYRSRSAFKLAQLDDKAKILKPGARVVDLGAAPGGWCQIALERVGAKGQVVGVDVNELDPIPGAVLLQGDVREPETLERVRAALAGAADAVLSDMAAPSTGHAKTDHLRIMGLVEIALDFAERLLAPDGAFVAKVLHGGTEAALLTRLKRDFAAVRHVKPKASRSDSAEMYVVATGFRGPAQYPEAAP